MKTKFYNVGHGEAITIEVAGKQKESCLIIRDFGRSKFTKDTKYINTLDELMKNDFNPDLWIKQYGRVDAMLSHAHEDHVNGFFQLKTTCNKNIFENGYIPWLRMNDLNDLGGLLIKCSLLVYRYHGNKSILGIHAKHWLLAVPIMAILSKKLYCVSSGYELNQYDTNCKILWPPIDEQYYETRLKKYLQKYIEMNDINNEVLNQYSEDIRRFLSKLYSKEPNESIEVASNLNFETPQQIETILERILEDKYFAHIKQPKNLYYNGYKPSIDNHSIMFEITDNNESSLFLSDADDKSIKIMLNNHKIKNKKYCFIKSSHHGNRGAKSLEKAGVTSEYIVNCCGAAHSNWNGPDIDYFNISKKIICTGWNDKKNLKWKHKCKYHIINSKDYTISSCKD